jgi:molybdenum cofactor cytidylyltransferase
MSEARHAAVLLAAGESRRLGVPKQLLTIDGEPLVRRAARAALATCPAQALIVVGARADAVYAAVADLALTRVACAAWEQGLSASIQAGVREVDPKLAAALFVLADQPALEADHLQALVARWRTSVGRAVASAYGGVIGVPAVLPRGWFSDLYKLSGDQGARELLRARAADVSSVPAPGLALDIDSPADVARLSSAPHADD